MKKFLALCLLLGSALSAQTSTVPQNFNSPVRFKVVANNDELTKISVLDNTGLMHWRDAATLQGISNHNNLSNLQGGTGGQYYHLTASQYQRVTSMIYANNTSSFYTAPVTGERGVSTSINLYWNIVSNDDIFTAASVSPGPGIINILSSVNQGLTNAGTGPTSIGKVFTLTMNYTRNGVATTETKTTTYRADIPQFAGVSAVDDYSAVGNPYGSLSTGLTKYIQPTSTIVRVVNPTEQYVWFVSINGNAIIQDGNNFTQTVGDWDSTTTEFIKRSFNMLLSDGVTTSEVHLYRSRTKKTLSNFTYKIN